ncbi:hypothetical protein OBBRIDRAFT_792222 [Obba rivulosa]|uniref:BTB domain-containing protein n=1 Tax=Obba rivulosa TaxID=1052685 RepID=A0A8E2AW90_9APHY|nr:hypothetical protein OBBRIDRAFT_792222 [Obba rivulosa]
MRLEHPFTKPSADAIIRSCDNVDFRVHRAILSEASPVFEAMFSLPRPQLSADDQEHRDGLPVITMTETAATLDAVLRFCYPMPDPDFASIDALAEVLEAARKYAIDVILAHAVRLLRGSFLDENPFAVFGVAYRMQMKEVAMLAARESLKKKMPEAGVLPVVPAAAFAALVRWRARCVTTAIKFMHGRTDPIPDLEDVWYVWEGVQWELCTSCKNLHYEQNTEIHQDALLQSDFVEDAIAALAEHPCGATLMRCKTVALKVIPDLPCVGCQKEAVLTLHDDILPGLSEALDLTLEETVPLNLDF